MANAYKSNNTNQVREAHIAVTLAGLSSPAEDFVNQLHHLIGRLAATEHSRDIREGIARRRVRIIQTETGGHHDE